jgi:hypothetical protein
MYLHDLVKIPEIAQSKDELLIKFLIEDTPFSYILKDSQTDTQLHQSMSHNLNV